MKLELFEKLIRKIIREELEMTVEPLKKQLNEIKSQSSISKPLGTNNTSQANFNPNSLEVSNSNKLVDGIKDPSLKEIFSTIEPLEDNKVTSVLDSFRSLQEQAFHSEDPSSIQVDNTPSTGLEQVFMKDYSQLMNAIDNKKNFRP